MYMYICISRCLMAEFRAPLVQSPYLLVAGQYDSALLKKNLGKHNLLPIPGPWRGFYEFYICIYMYLYIYRYIYTYL